MKQDEKNQLLYPDCRQVSRWAEARRGRNFSSVLGGSGNTNSGAYSSILGGVGNNIGAGYQYVGVFGQNVPATINNALHLENLWLKPTSYCNYFGTPPPLFFPAGTVYVDTSIGNALRVF